ncbi:hydroxyisourate hydrolase [Isoptericola sp. AK164]|uniref:hydroxyisourate hydrolase n=1 Tax=Isoptericola sp. AK164 TaxID=3024246 RepID=UPI002418AB43|nr:hydroxyisourate hydrolase [Isoptericola sp. AK164]
MSHLTTHVLDAGTGEPATGLRLELTDSHGQRIDDTDTDDDGRADLGPNLLPSGTYTLTFDTGTYFAEREVETFYPSVAVTFVVTPEGAGRHYHVPLLLSPFAYSTYRGS